MGLVPAKIEILDEDAVDERRGLPAVINVQFNPTEYSLTKGQQSRRSQSRGSILPSSSSSPVRTRSFARPVLRHDPGKRNGRGGEGCDSVHQEGVSTRQDPAQDARAPRSGSDGVKASHSSPSWKA